mgnify:FL=1
MTPEQAPDGVREAVEKEVKHINQKVRSKAARVNNALRNAELEVLKGQRGGKRYRKPHSKRTYQASSPGEPPARRTGALRLQWAKGVDGGSSGSGGAKYTAYIESQVPYAGYLENGTSKMAARPYVEKIKEKAKAGIAQMEDFSRVGSVVIKDKQQWIGLIFRNAVKITCLYALPAVAIFAVTGERLPLSVLECLAFSSVMQLLIGVIPSSGGTGSTELVFLMLFGSMTEKSVCGAAMILYRMATYYLPFLISIPLLFFGKRSTEA